MKNIYLYTLIIALLGCTVLSACKSLKSEEPDEFTVSLRSPSIEIGEVEFQMDTLMGFGGLAKRTAKVLYFPREDAVGLAYRQEYMNYHQFWSREGRHVFIEALKQYNEDYDARNLNRSGGKKAMKKYGSVEGYLVWQQFSFTVQAAANMNVGLGYAFKDRAPYFVIRQGVAEYKDKISRDNNRNSSILNMYLTRAQAAELSALFEQHYLNSLSLPGPGGNTFRSEDVSRDDYQE